MTPADLNILWMPDLLAVAQEFATNASAHTSTFHSAWSKVRSPPTIQLLLTPQS
jgi:hypothetical protein